MDEQEGQDHTDRAARVTRVGPGRRGTDRDRDTDWQRPGFWLSVMGFLLTIALVLLGAIWNKLDTMNSTMTAFAVSSAAQSRDIQALQDFKKEQRNQDDMRDTYTSNTREKVLKMEQKLEDFGIIKPGELNSMSVAKK